MSLTNMSTQVPEAVKSATFAPVPVLGKRKASKISGGDDYEKVTQEQQPKKACHAKLECFTPRPECFEPPTPFEMRRQRSRQDVVDQAKSTRKSHTPLAIVKRFWKRISQVFKQAGRGDGPRCPCPPPLPICSACYSYQNGLSPLSSPARNGQKRRGEGELEGDITKLQKYNHSSVAAARATSIKVAIEIAEEANAMEIDHTDVAETPAPTTPAATPPVAQPILQQQPSDNEMDLDPQDQNPMTGVTATGSPKSFPTNTPAAQVIGFGSPASLKPANAPKKQEGLEASRHAPTKGSSDDDIHMVDTPTRAGPATIPGLASTTNNAAHVNPHHVTLPLGAGHNFQVPSGPPPSARRSVKPPSTAHTNADSVTLPPGGGHTFQIPSQPPSSAAGSVKSRATIIREQLDATRAKQAQDRAKYGKAELLKSRFANANGGSPAEETNTPVEAGPGTKPFGPLNTSRPAATAAAPNQSINLANNNASMASVVPIQSSTRGSSDVYSRSPTVVQCRTADQDSAAFGRCQTLNRSVTGVYSDTNGSFVTAGQVLSSDTTSSSAASTLEPNGSSGESSPMSAASTAPTSDNDMVLFDDDDSSNAFLPGPNDDLEESLTYFGKHRSPDEPIEMSPEAIEMNMRALPVKMHVLPRTVQSFLASILKTEKCQLLPQLDPNNVHNTSSTIRKAIASGKLWNLTPIFKGDGSSQETSNIFSASLTWVGDNRIRFEALIHSFLNMGYSLATIIAKCEMACLEDLVDGPNSFVIDNKRLDDGARKPYLFPDPLVFLDEEEQVALKNILKNFFHKRIGASIEDIQGFVKRFATQFEPLKFREFFINVLRKSGYCKKGQWKTLNRLRATLLGRIESSAFSKLTPEVFWALRWRLEQMYPRSMKWGFEGAESCYPLSGKENELDLLGSWEEDGYMMPQAAPKLGIVETEEDSTTQDDGKAPSSTLDDELLANILAEAMA